MRFLIPGTLISILDLVHTTFALVKDLDRRRLHHGCTVNGVFAFCTCYDYFWLLTSLAQSPGTCEWYSDCLDVSLKGGCRRGMQCFPCAFLFLSGFLSSSCTAKISC